MRTAEPADLVASIASVTDELVREFGAAVSPRLIARTVVTAANRLTGYTGAAPFAEALADLARSRLSALRVDLSA